MASSAVASSPRFARGERIAGRWEIERELGRGGMGIVYAVRDVTSDQRVALKLLSHGHDGAIGFRREFQTLARLEHPRVVRVLDFGSAGDRLFYTMELLEGRDLRAMKRIEIGHACSILRDVASALAMLHARGLLHGDVSPRNIRCTSTGHAKIFDFGLLSTMGAAHDIAGTPPYIAPECLYGLPLDQRADIFSLGAVFYYLLAGEHAFGATTVGERLDELRFRYVPVPLADLVPEIPAGIDALVTSMLSLDRQARPSSAADVIDRIQALTGLAPSSELEVARGWVRSAALVGRERELATLRSHVERAAAGRGAAVLVRGRSGAGKSRLLRELGLEAKLQGAIAIHISLETRCRGSFEAVRRVFAELSRALPELVAETTRPRAALLSAAIPELAGAPVASLVSGGRADPRERRLVLQQELCEWLIELSARQPIALVLDDIQRCDESSAAVLLALARRIHECSIALVASLRTDEPAAAARVIDALARVTESMPIEGLQAEDMEALVRASFGEVPNATRLAELLRSKTGGSPLLASDLLGALVDAGLIAYQGGMWTIADDIASAELPESVVASCDAQVATLDGPALELAELLAVLGGVVALETCVALVGDEARAFAGIDALLERELLSGRGDAHRFRHDGLREAILRRLTPPRLRALHRRIGTVLLELAAGGQERDGEIGWHLVEGGEDRKGAELLERAGRQLYEATAFADAIRPLATAIEVYEAHGLAKERAAELHYMLAISGFFADRAVADGVSDRTLALLAVECGIERMARLQRVLGARGGFLGGLAQTAITRRLAPRDRRGPTPKAALSMFAHTVLLTGGLALAQAQRERLLELRRRIAPLASIRIGNLDRVYRFFTMLEAVSFGRFGEARDTAQGLLSDEDERRAGSWATEFELRVFHGAVRFAYGLALAHSDRWRALENIEALERLDVKLWQLGAQQLRHTYHLRRGEADAAAEILAQLELRYTELGSVWQLELGHAPGNALALALIGDVLGLRRAIDRLQRLVDTGVDHTGALELARADYHRERGELEPALAAVERGLQRYRIEANNVESVGGFGLGWGLTCRAQVLLEAGRIDDAAAAVEHAMTIVADPAHRDDGVYFRCGRVAALVDAARGDPAAAAARLDLLLAEAAPTENPAYLGLLHEARAVVATTCRELVVADRHRRRAAAWFRGTDNPVLIGRLDRLQRLLAIGHPRGVADPASSADLTLAAAPEGSARFECALALLVESSAAAGGHFYRVVGDEVVLVASHADEIAPAELAPVLVQAMGHGLGWQALYRGEGGSYRMVVLRIDPGLADQPVAVAALRAGDDPLQPPDLELVAAIAMAIAPAPELPELHELELERRLTGSPRSGEPETVVE